MRPSRWPAPLAGGLLVLCLLFFGSGFAALVYQVVWLRSLSLVFGVTVHAASTVLAGFMTGLAVGSWLAGRWPLGPSAALAAFAAAEFGVGVTAVIAAPVIGWLTEAYAALRPGLSESFALLTAARFALATAVLIVPTSLMGATLPLLVRATADDPRVGMRLGALYATNTAGAIAGALAAGFYLVPALGLRRSAWLAAAVNVAVAAIALAVRAMRAAPSASAGAATTHEPPAIDEIDAEPAARRTILAVFAASGFVSLALEIVWFRVLALHLRPTGYAFTIMLAAVLAGISAGSFVVTPLLHRRRPWLAVLASLQMAIALVAVLSLNSLPLVDVLQSFLGPGFRLLRLPDYVWPLVTTSLVAILPTSLLLGAAFPIGLRLFVGRDPDPGRRVAAFYALNVCGAIAGSAVGGFLLLPMLGSRGTLVAVSAVALLSSLALANRLWATHPNAAGFVSLVGPVAFLMATLNAIEPFENVSRRQRLLWRGEGVQTTVSVEQQRGGARVMYLDGMHQADDSRSSRLTHQSIGALPMMLHPRPARVLVIGLGGGATPGAVAKFPGAQVDVVELSSDVVTASRYFGHINFDLFTRHNVHLRVDDGRNHLLTTRTRYDVITADAILPSRNGATNLYSREYFQLARRALAPGGLVLQWLGSDSDFEYKLILRTFLAVFPETTLWGGHSLMVGTTEPFTFSASRFAERREDPAFRAVFDWKLRDIERWYSAGPRELAAFVGEGPILSDDRPLPEYFLSMPDSPPRAVDRLSGAFADVLRP